MKKISKLFIFLNLFFPLLLSSCANKSEKVIIHTDDAPLAVGPYEQAIVFDNIVYCSGQIGIDPSTNQLVEGGLQQEVHQIFKNIKAVLLAASSSLDNVIKTTVYLTDIAHFNIMNEIYSTYFTDNNYPARSAVEVSSLPKGASIEIEVVAYQNK